MNLTQDSLSVLCPDLQTLHNFTFNDKFNQNEMLRITYHITNCHKCKIIVEELKNKVKHKKRKRNGR